MLQHRSTRSFCTLMILLDLGLGCDHGAAGARARVEAAHDGSAQLTTSPLALDQFIRARQEEAHIAGLEAIIVKHGQVVFNRGYGLADLARHSAVTGETVFRVASISKTFTLTALMRLYEQGRFALDDDVSKVAGFRIRHPHYQSIPITYRMLLSHSAGIVDNYAIVQPLWNWRGDSQMPLGRMMTDYFSAGGAAYSAKNFLAAAPGSSVHYANMGIALAGFLVERLGGESFAKVVQKQVTDPLGLDQASWYATGFTAKGGSATPYQWDDENGRFHALGPYSYPELPAGMLRISGNQLARFMQMYIGGGQLDQVRLLQPDTVAEIFRAQRPDLKPSQGLVFYRLEAPSGRRLIGHAGGDPGIASAMFWQEQDPAGLGVVLLANSDPTVADEAPGHPRETAFYEILERLFVAGESL